TTNYPNLTNKDLSELTTLVDADTTTVNTEKYQIHDQSLKSILDQAQAWEDAKIAAMDEIGRLSNLNATQISHLKDKVKTSSHSQTETIKNEAIELDKSIQALKDEALRELKELSKNSSLTTQNMFEASKSANKYKFAEPSLQNVYNQQLEAAKTLFTKANATKDQVDQAKNNLLSAFNALNGDEKLNALK
ncbi:GA module-containing protein, partial [Mycoplasmopsis pullorum]|uniref:GA module-containing protein n=1 Tax=Mycoplasmopsis pullorum TaxID=48003 RepID=UPI001118944C